MKILEIVPLSLQGVLVIRFQRFQDERGYFTEHFRQEDFDSIAGHLGLEKVKFLQANESRSQAKVIRGLHFQWNPYMGKLVRCTSGRMVDLALDLRRASGSLGQIILYDMPYHPEATFQEWIWLPPGFAHGNYYTQASTIEYFCTGQWNPDCEAGISPLAEDILWDLADPKLKAEFDSLVNESPILSAKDKGGLSLRAWLEDPRSQKVFGKDFK
ncbi:MAG: dTDP-4-dehydrorhamnose 3,5-epimerase family protein [Deltaproteobacteria bacterium]|jgi:dTDP-4-dehydrorhamnose 3,5-epimerase|nr:dTDP-4-dehydrorhamnose 3,5-epimerase family protein [Deltaproteobacteria bacterium]